MKEAKPPAAYCIADRSPMVAFDFGRVFHCPACGAEARTCQRTYTLEEAIASFRWRRAIQAYINAMEPDAQRVRVVALDPAEQDIADFLQQIIDRRPPP
jgi:predicted transcriptional regulator